MRALALFFVFTLAACAELSSWKSWHFQLPDGAYVSFISGNSMVAEPVGVYFYSMPDLTGDAKLYGNSIEHVIEEGDQKVLAYRLRIEQAGESAHIVTIQPVAGAPFFLQAPKPLQLLDGHRAEIDLATSKDGYVKAVASIQITKYERRLSDIPASRAKPQDLTLDALQLRVTEAQVFKNNVRIAEHAGGAIGSTLVAYLPGVGRVFFSLVPQNDFDFAKAAVIENSRIIFDIGSDHYEIASKGSVIGQPGPWKIYMLRAPDTTPCNQMVEPSEPFIWAQTLTLRWLNCQAQ